MSHVPIVNCNLDQLDILHELQVNLANLAKNGLDFIEYVAGASWSEYFNLEPYVALGVIVKELWRFSNGNKDGEVLSMVLELLISIT